MNTREKLFDNVRGILIYLVVLGHLMAFRREDALIIKGIYYAIYMFHMPAFVFITGYFSKNTERSRDTAVEKFLIPFFVFNTAFTIVDYIVKGKLSLFTDSYDFTEPKWGLWFLMACFIWKLLANEFVQMRAGLAVSLAIGLCVPFFPYNDSMLGFGRCIGFLPFFVAGLRFRAEWLEKLRRVPRWVGGGVLGVSIIFSAYIGWHNLIPRKILYLQSPYEDGYEIEQMLMRLVVYLMGTLMTLCLLICVTRKECALSKIGEKTMVVYLFNLILIHFLDAFGLFRGRPFCYLVFSIAFAAVYVWIMSRKKMNHAYNVFMQWIYKCIFLPSRRS